MRHFLWLIPLAAVIVTIQTSQSPIRVERVLIDRWNQAGGAPAVDGSAAGSRFSCGAGAEQHGIGVRAPSSVLISAPVWVAGLSGACCVDDLCPDGSSIRCRVRVDGEIAFKSPEVRRGAAASPFSLAFPKHSEIVLEVEDLTPQARCGLAGWSRLTAVLAPWVRND